VVSFSNATEVEAALSARIGGYNKTRLRREDFPHTAVALACERAERLDSAVGGGDIPDANTSRVYLLWKAIAAKAQSVQFPPELQGLLSEGRLNVD